MQLAAIVQARTADKAEKTALEHAKRTAEEQLSCTEAKLAQVLINARSVITDRKQLQVQNGLDISLISRLSAKCYLWQPYSKCQCLMQ